MIDIAIYGAGGFGREVLALINAINGKGSGNYNFVGFFDDAADAKVKDYKVLGNRDDLKNYNHSLQIVFAVGNPYVKEQLVNYVSSNEKLKYPSLVHPNVVIGDKDTVEIGEGSIITAGCILTCDIEIGSHVILNLSCTVGHDSIIMDHASFMPTVNISGEVVVEKGVFVGTGAKIINQKRIGEYSVIGAGAVVSSDIPAKVTAVGVPAKVIKHHD